MNRSPMAPILNKRSVLIADILGAFRDLEIEELEAIERYVENYHEAYQKLGDNHIITEISIEPIEDY